MKILGVETSCDETAAAVVENGDKLLSNVVASSIDLHRQYGGVVPEIAARSHIEAINPVIEKALTEAFPRSKGQRAKSFDPWDQIDGIAVTRGPGLSGSLLVGVLAARTLAIVKNKPLYPVNHVEAHVYAAFITESSSIFNSQFSILNDRQGHPALRNYSLPGKQPSFPLLALIVSGGHTQLVLFRNHFDYELLGRTHDDAVGEAFDKVAKMLGLPYPGGPSVEEAAKSGDETAYTLPKPNMRGAYDFSYSGLKTAVLRTAQQTCGKSYDFPSRRLGSLLSNTQKSDLAASFQRAAFAQLADKTSLAAHQFLPANIVIGGGVAASGKLRKIMNSKLSAPVIYADPKLCTDNGAMIAVLGCFKRQTNTKPADPYSLDIKSGLSM
jgi:N6-L-threonylcarbamoyladenine synthase